MKTVIRSSLSLLLFSFVITEPQAQHIKGIERSLQRAKNKLAQLEYRVSAFVSETDADEQQRLRGLIRAHLHSLTTTDADKKRDNIQKEEDLLTKISAPTKKLYHYILKIAQGLNRQSPIHGAEQINLEAETFLAGSIKLIHESSHMGQIIPSSLRKDTDALKSEKTAEPEYNLPDLSTSLDFDLPSTQEIQNAEQDQNHPTVPVPEEKPLKSITEAQPDTYAYDRPILSDKFLLAPLSPAQESSDANRLKKIEQEFTELKNKY